MKKLLLFLPIVIISASDFFFLNFNPLLIKEEKVSLNGVSCVTENEIRSEVRYLNQNILLINEGSAERKITNQYICVRSVSIKREFPDTVEIDVQGRVPSLVLYSREQDASLSAQVNNFLADITPSEATPSSQSALLEDVIKDPRLSYSGNSFLVDGDGVVYSKLTGNVSIPAVIVYKSNLRIGKKISPQNVSGSIRVLHTLKDLSIPVTLALIKENNLGIKGSNMSLFFALDSDLDRQLASLQLILQASTMNEVGSATKGQKIRSIDLRFNKPVVVYSQ